MTQARNLVKQGSLRVNDCKVELDKTKFSDYQIIADCLYIIKTGKKDFYSILLV